MSKANQKAPPPAAAPANKPPVDEPKQEVVLVDRNPPAHQLPAHLQAQMEADAGKGVSTAAEDNLVPIITILQQLSPQVNRRQPGYIEGAEAGDIFLKAMNPPFVRGEEGITFQPCHFWKKWVEWIPRDSGGGYVAAYDEADRPPYKEIVDDKNPNKKRYVMENGHELIETRYHAGYVHLSANRVIPFVIPFASTGHTVSRQWMFSMNSLQLPNGKGVVPSFATLYHLTSKERSNVQGTWFVWEPTFAGYVQNESDYKRGADLARAFASGEKQAEALGDELQTEGAAASGEGAAM